ncbi:helix-turn-helix domain-containing protein [Haliangium sp. UPWRP_2]|uniref:helix-turn-helix domain-containing protein n=1 Tax=Haliangium sp. UPWRP_2 TaxID=1931276 RepID=UPI000B53F815|nr:helix-turn-helix domain-containing protein [Haliangium sp. UPWRP_2]PSM31696.1 helix-turn-helix domain-containing protein [Haliangium sp. UPWRP_2]
MKNQWVKDARESEGWNLAELAQRTGLSIARLTELEIGEPIAPDEAALIREAVNAPRRKRIRRAIDRLTHSRRSQRSIERLLGLSQGYLCRLRAGDGNPSPALIAVLLLLANDPRRLDELSR